MVRKLIFICCLLVAAELAAAKLKASEIPRKKLAGPPSEFADHEIPTPLYGALLEDSAYFKFSLAPKHAEKAKSKMIYETPITVDSSEEFIVSIMATVNDIEVELVDPNGNEVDLDGHEFQGYFPIGSYDIPATSYRFENPVVGVYQLSIQTQDKFTVSERKKLQDAAPHGAIIVWNKSQLKAHTHLNTYTLTLSSNIGLVTSMTADETLIPGVRPTALKEVIGEAELDVIMPDGSEVDVQMQDDGLHGDLEANDGIYGATIAATETGTYLATAYISGTDGNGVAFERSTQHVIPVVVDYVNLVGTATGSLTDQQHMDIDIQITTQGDVQDKLFRAYAQVWGTDANGNEVAACWIGGMTEAQQQSGSTFVTLELDLQWLSMAQVSAPLTLKQVVVQETASFVPVDQADSISVQTSSTVNKYLQTYIASTKVSEITKEMRVGRRTRPTLAARNITAGSGTLILLHGYCAGVNPWPEDDFSQASFFLNANANQNNEDFATDVYNWAEENGYPSYGIVGHSQGGMVGLHLLNYFETGLDDASGQRLLQSVGTPYSGCSAAGSAADLGSVFGTGCGSNTDLSTDGAKLWLAGISSAAKAEVHFFTTTYELGNWFGDYCSMPMNAVLDWPNDGVTEYDNALLSGGVNMGNTEKQCHTTEMAYIAQYQDGTRNAGLNSAAAR